ncbi:MAG: SDR family NAD(P)-dependent oxidoreductase [Clostridiales Family XIII bacterium]|jgi:acyl transferase domain-containing protein/NAD(P)H-dependent flavin oxidoreductase YrpB (nitropropane dioxygenase family)/NAD(P)-dependent dehydrogenase (short-subunit alcohol dehydrogenase family)/acyl carrier protein|nr:SDR family NAD(P)-dependent oxidoreductase [Clostridiales Family XIII bacterium]
MQTKNKKKEVMVLTPFEMPDVELALDTIKAGAFPVLHLGRDLETAEHVLSELSLMTDEPFGVCLADRALKGLKLPEQVTVIITAYGKHYKRGITVKNKEAATLYQVHSVKEAEAAIAEKAPAIIIKGSEGAGFVAEESSFIIFQKIIGECLKNKIDLYIQGGAGVHTSAAYLGLGAQGVILDSQVALLPECRAPQEVKNTLVRLTGSEMLMIDGFRVLTRPNSPKLADETTFEELRAYLGGFDLSANYIPVGLDVTFSVDFKEKYKNLNTLVFSIHEAAYSHLRQAKALGSIAPDNGLAEYLGIKYPVAQGPMARVSDVPEFAREVAKGGALPFTALSMASGAAAEKLLTATAAKVGGRPWGVGILGFAYPQLVDEQTKLILQAKPDVVLIAGGRPSQAKPFEKEGIKVFLHTPATGLLDMFLKEGARNFIFEGRESGGHVGPLPSTVLWEKQIVRLLQEEDKSSINVFFAGGIHDALSSAFVSIMSAPLAAGAMKVGVLVGTAYLYTKEIVETGAITKEYQQSVIKQNETMLLKTAYGQETRALRTPYTQFFNNEKTRMLAEGIDPKEVWVKLEEINMGRLRIASKGVKRQGDELIKVSDDEQLESGLFMTGEVTTLVDKTTSVRRLHSAVTTGGNEFLAKLNDMPRPDYETLREYQPCDIAIIGMAGVFPFAEDLDEYWKNILFNKDCVTEVSDYRWSRELFFKQEGRDTDYSVSKWGAFLQQTDFDALEFGITPQSLPSIEPVQLLSLLIAKRALADAGYGDIAKADFEDTSVIFGAQGAGELTGVYGSRTGLKGMLGEIPESIDASLPKLTEDSFPGMLSNVISGRITNRLNMGGRNYTVDAACASSLAALDVAFHELHSKRSNMVVLGGADLHNSINDFLMFSSTFALSKKGYCSTFDSDADGITLGEGIGVVILKRLEDAKRDCNKIYAVIKGIGGSSDGRNLGLTAPSKGGQMKALRRAYKSAGITPSDVGLIEAHGTGTVVGDRIELSALTDVFVESGALPGQTNLGSVKTQIGHTKCAAGIAGLIKATMAVKYGVLPPTLHLNNPNSAYKGNNPFTFNAEKPGIWNKSKRIAGVSGFGFGGTNFHTILQNYEEEIPQSTIMNAWPSELFIFRGDTPEEAKELMAKVKTLYSVNNTLRIRDVAYSLLEYNEKDVQIVIVASNHEELTDRIDKIIDGAIGTDDAKRAELSGVYFRNPVEGKVAFLFSGQGSQRVNMARDLFVIFPFMRKLIEKNPEYMDILFPASAFTNDEKKAQRSLITDTRNAQPLLGVVDYAIADFLRSLDIVPDMVAGHSYGEIPALCFADAFSPDYLMSLSSRRAESILGAVGGDPGKMAAVTAAPDELADLLKGETEVWAVNYNSEKQTVVAGTSESIKSFIAKATEKKISCKELNVACAFHSPLIANSKVLFADALRDVAFKKPTVQVWSNTTAAVYPASPESIKNRLADHLVNPVRFSEQLVNMYEDGARVFVEAGPGNVLIGLVSGTLGRDKDVITIQTEKQGKDGLTFLLQALARYVSTGRKVNMEKLYDGRDVETVNIDTPDDYRKNSTVWYIDGKGAVPSNGKPPLGEGAQTGTILSLKDLMKGSVNESVTFSPEAIMMAYLDNMNAMIQDQRDVMLGYLGEPEMSPRTPYQRTYVNRQPIQAPTSGAAEGVEVAVQVSEADAVQSEAGTGDTIPNVFDVSPEELKDIILDVVSTNTGYPIDMLGMDVDLEADLSIDSIKRLEIIGALQERVRFSEGAIYSEDSYSKMVEIKTLSGLVNWIVELGKQIKASLDAEGAADADGQKPAEAAGTTEAAVEAGDTDEVTRVVFESEAFPLNRQASDKIKGKRFALIDDEGGFAAAVKTQLEAEGAIVEFIAKDAGDLTAYDGLIVINICESPVNITVSEFFNLVKAADLSKIQWIQVFDDAPGTVLATDGVSEVVKLQGFTGLVKTLAQEYADVNSRAVSLLQKFEKEAFAKLVLDELLAEDYFAEIFYDEGERRRNYPRLKAIKTADSPNLELDNNSVVLVLGGAQGITRELTAKMAAEYPCKYILVGRSAENKEDDEKYGELNSVDEIRKRLIDEGELKELKAIETRAKEIFKTVQISKSIKLIEANGGTVAYLSANVKDKDEFRTLISGVKEKYGKIDAVIHAAGILEDKLFQDKTLESFERTYQTKVNPMYVIAEELLPDLKLLVMYSSVSATFGNVGQCDYASGNSVLDQTAYLLGRKGLETKIIAFNWGPWKGAGMVSKGLETEMKKKGMSLIQMDAGSRIYIDDLKYGDVSQVLAIAGNDEGVGAFLLNAMNSRIKPAGNKA